jgi:hypothetical protein
MKRIDGIETGDSTCYLQRQVDKPKYILSLYISPKYQATKYEAETTDSTVFQPYYPSEDVHETHNLKHTNTDSQCYYHIIKQAGSRTYPSPQGIQASLVLEASYKPHLLGFYAFYGFDNHLCVDVAERRVDDLCNYAVQQSFEIHLGAFWGPFSISCFSKQFLKIHNILFNFWPFYS